LWHGDVALTIYVYRLGVVLAATALAVMLARGRTQVGRDRERFALLSAVAEIADGTLSLADTVAALNALVVPTVADICIVDAASHGELRRLAVHGLEQEDQAVAALAARPPSTADVLGDPEQARLVRAWTRRCCGASRSTTTISAGCARWASRRRSSCRCMRAAGGWAR